MLDGDCNTRRGIVTDTDELRSIDQFPFEFYGSLFSVFLASDRRLYVPLSDLCEAMEIDTNAQAQRIRRNEAINDALITLPLQVPYGDEGALQMRRLLCLWLNRLPYWLGTIEASRIPDADRRRQVVRFQREFADVAWAAFRSEILSEEIRAEMDAALPPAQQRYLTAMDEAATMRRQLEHYGDRLGDVEERLGNLEARISGTDFINQAQAQRYQVMVNVLATILKRRGKGNQATIHAEVKRTFHVPSYQLIPEEEFQRVVDFLANWYRRLTPPGTPLPDVFNQPDQRSLF
jgi:hypothetical protein